MVNKFVNCLSVLIYYLEFESFHTINGAFSLLIFIDDVIEYFDKVLKSAYQEKQFRKSLIDEIENFINVLYRIRYVKDTVSYLFIIDKMDFENQHKIIDNSNEYDFIKISDIEFQSSFDFLNKLIFQKKNEIIKNLLSSFNADDDIN